MLRKFTFPLLRIILLVIILLLITASFAYFFSPVYKFDEPQPFSGSGIYNPYENIDAAFWKKGNFHTHTTASDGKNSPEEVREAYENYKYDILAISDHSVITRGYSISEKEIPAYEHGLNISKYHSLVLGAKKGSGFDFIFLSTLSHKYHMLKWLNGRSDLVILAHPDKTRWLNPGHLASLSNYHLMEVQKHIGDGSLRFYDSALSAGHYSGVMANDDCHDINSSRQFGRAVTFVNTPGTGYDDIRDALLEGRSYAVVLPDFKDIDIKRRRNLNLPFIRRMRIINDTVEFSVSEPATVNVFGQNGILKRSFSDQTVIRIPFEPEDTYLRFAAIFPDGVILYSNPLVRYNGEKISFQNLASVNYPMTLVQTFITSTVVVLLIRLFFIVLAGMLSRSMVEWLKRYRIFTTLRPRSALSA